MIAKIFFRQILTLTDMSSVSFSDLMATVASYLSLNTGSAEREAETAVETICSNFFLISNLQGFEFANASGKHIAIHDPDKRHADFSYFTFRSVVSAIAVDARTLDKIVSIEFSLRQPQTFVSLSCSTELPVTAIVDTSTIAKPSDPESNIRFQLGNYTDDMLDELGVDNMRLLIAKAGNLSIP